MKDGGMIVNKEHNIHQTKPLRLGDLGQSIFYVYNFAVLCSINFLFYLITYSYFSPDYSLAFAVSLATIFPMVYSLLRGVGR